MNDLTRTTITSIEAAEWCGKEHKEDVYKRQHEGWVHVCRIKTI